MAWTKRNKRIFDTIEKFGLVKIYTGLDDKEDIDTVIGGFSYNDILLCQCYPKMETWRGYERTDIRGIEFPKLEIITLNSDWGIEDNAPFIAPSIENNNTVIRFGFFFKFDDNDEKEIDLELGKQIKIYKDLKMKLEKDEIAMDFTK